VTLSIIHADCLEAMRAMEANSIDSIVTDPPYGLAFMGKKWDYDVPSEEIWREALRVLKPGGHLLAFFGGRTYHRGVVRIEDAGFEIRDQLAWLYGSGFPKSLNLQGDHEGWGTALKPAMEPIVLARKPFRGTVAQNVLTYGTGGLNVDACRIESGGDKLAGGAISSTADGWDRPWKHDQDAVQAARDRISANTSKAEQLGRWPANVLHDGSDEVVDLFPSEAGATSSITGNEPSQPGRNTYGGFNHQRAPTPARGDSGSAARFFYCAKASRSDRNHGLRNPGPQLKYGTTLRKVEQAELKGNVHPTVKPTDLMRWLVRLITPCGGTVLDPFAGSGSTGKAAILEGFSAVLIEREAEYISIIEARCRAAQPGLIGAADLT
jgi:DNA modification methylase